MQCLKFLKVDCAAVILVMDPESGRQMNMAEMHAARE